MYPPSYIFESSNYLFICMYVYIYFFIYANSKNLIPLIILFQYFLKIFSSIFSMTPLTDHLQLAILVYVLVYEHHLSEALKNSPNAFYYLQISSFRVCTNFWMCFALNEHPKYSFFQGIPNQTLSLELYKNLNKAKSASTTNIYV